MQRGRRYGGTLPGGGLCVFPSLHVHVYVLTIVNALDVGGGGGGHVLHGSASVAGWVVLDGTGYLLPIIPRVPSNWEKKWTLACKRC